MGYVKTPEEVVAHLADADRLDGLGHLLALAEQYLGLAQLGDDLLDHGVDDELGALGKGEPEPAVLGELF